MNASKASEDLSGELRSGREEAGCTLRRVKAWVWRVSEVCAAICVGAVTKQFVQSPPGERQLFGALLFRSRTASPEGCLSPSLPSAFYELIATAGRRRSQPGTQGRARARECVWVPLRGRHRSLKRSYCFFLMGI